MTFPSVLQSSSFQKDDANASTFEVTRPAGLTNGNTLIMVFACDGNRTITMTADGFTHMIGSTSEGSVSLRAGQLKIDGSEPATFTITTSGNERAAAVVYEIQDASDPTVDAPGITSTSGSSAIPNPPLRTTGAAKDYLWLAAFGSDRDKTVDSFPANMTVGSVQLNENGGGANSCSIGADTHQLNDANFNPDAFGISATEGWIAFTINVQPAPPGGETMVAAQGDYALSGQAAITLWKHKMVAAQGSYAQTGYPAVTSKGYKTVAGQGSYTLTGYDALFPRTHVMVGGQGSYNLNGQASNLLWGHLMLGGQGSYGLTGYPAITSRQVTIVGAQGGYALTGYAAGLLWKHLMTAAQGAYALTGYAADTRVGFTMAAAQGSYSLSGQDAILLWKRLIAAAQGSYTLTGYDADTLFGFRMLGAQGAYSLTGQPAILLWDHAVEAAQGSYALTGYPAITTRALLILTAQGAYAYTGYAADTFVTELVVMDADQGGYTLTGYDVVTVFSGQAAGSLLIPIGRRRRRM